MKTKPQLYIGMSKDSRELGEFYKEWTGKGCEGGYPVWDCHDIVARRDGEIVGVLQLRIINDPFFNRKWGLIENVYVTPSARRLGVASELMGYAEGQAGGFGCEFIKLTSRKKEGQSLYRSLGYEEGCAFYKNVKMGF